MSRGKGSYAKNDYAVAAVEFVDKNGIDALTMRALGVHMGVDPTAVYRHFPTKEELVGAMCDLILGEALEATMKAQATTPRQQILEFGIAFRDAFRKHPDIGVSIVQYGGASLNGYHFSRAGALELRKLGIKPEFLTTAYQMYEGFIMGSCVQDFSGSPENFAVRRMRYRAFDIPEFDSASVDETAVETIADTAFVAGLNALLNYFESNFL